MFNASMIDDFNNAIAYSSDHLVSWVIETSSLHIEQHDI